MIAALVAVLAVIAIVYSDRGAVTSTQAGVPLLDRSHPAPGLFIRAQFDMVREQLAAQVKPGTRVHVYRAPQEQEGWTELWYQRLLEFTWMAGAHPVPDTEKADVRVWVAMDPTAMYGKRLVVERLAGVSQ